jgi:hypothetical protein
MAERERFADEIDHLDAAKPARHLTFVDHDPAGSADNPSSWSVHWHPCSPRRGSISKVIDLMQHQAAGGDGLILQGGLQTHFLDGPSRFCHPQHLLHPPTLTASNHDTAPDREPVWVMDACESPDSTHKDEPITAEEMETMIDQWAASCAKQLADNSGK